MKKSYSKSSRQGLPGGPNEMFQKVKGIIVSERGQWDFPGMNTLVPTQDGRITMRGVPYPVLGQDETGYTQMMYPEQEYQFPGQNVLELPMAQRGGSLPKFQNGGEDRDDFLEDDSNNNVVGTYYELPEVDIIDLDLPIYLTPQGFYERNKNLQTYFSEKDINSGVNYTLDYKPKPGNNPILIQKDFSDEAGTSWNNYVYPEYTYCTSEGCTARANRFVSSLFTSGSQYFQNPDKTKEYFGATFSADRPPTSDEIKRYPYAEGDINTVSLDAWDQVDAAQRTIPNNVLYSNIYVPKNGEITQSDIDKVAEKNIPAGEIWKKYKIPLGSIINVGHSPQNIANGNLSKRNIVAGTHTIRVVGYTDTGEPLVADYGQIRPLSKNMYGSNAYVAGIITVPGNEEFTYDHFVEKSKLKNKPAEDPDYYIGDILDPKNVESNPLKVFSDKKYSKEFVDFNNSIINEENRLRSKLNISKEKYDQYAKIALTIAGTETEFGKGIFYKLFDYGDSTGITQLNKKNIEDKYEKTLKPYKKGTPEYDAVSTILYIKELDKYKKEWSQKGSKAQERPFRMKEGYSTVAQAKKAVRNLQGKPSYGYDQSGGRLHPDTFTDEHGVVELPFKQPWQSKEDFTKEVNDVLKAAGREDLRFAFKDGKRTIFRKTLGNTIPDTLEDMVFYSWQSPPSYVYGDAQGDSNYYKKAKRIYGELFPTQKKYGGSLPKAQNLGQFNPQVFKPNPLTGQYSWEQKPIKKTNLTPKMQPAVRATTNVQRPGFNLDRDNRLLDAGLQNTNVSSNPLSPYVHTLLDAAGMVPILGEPADFANALLYNYEGDLENAATSTAGMIPILGMLGTGKRLLGKAGKGFKSKIDWGKWNPEIPNNKALMDEYLAIEQKAKADGTWMKNTDGTPSLMPDGSKPTPELWIQSQSKNWEKAYGKKGLDAINESYRGVGFSNSDPDFSKGFIEGDKAIFAADRNLANSYAWGPKIFEDMPVLTPNDPLGKSGVFHLMHPKGKIIDLNTLNSNWTNINLRGAASKSNIETSLNQLEDQLKIAKDLPKGVTRDNAIKHFKEKIDILKKNLEDFDKLETDPEALRELISEFPGRPATDEIAEWLPKTDINSIILRNINDGGLGNVTIFNNKLGKYAKSAVGNNGMFDMTNPNIYKALAPIMGLGAAGTYGANQLMNQQPESYKRGGSLPKAQNGEDLFPGEGMYYQIPEYTFEYKRRFSDLPTPRYTGPLMSQQLIDEATQREYEQRRRAIDESIAATRNPFSAERLAKESATTGDKLSLQMMFGDPYNSPRVYEALGGLDFINPAVMLGDMATGLGALPYNIQEGNYGSAALGLVSPLATGALASIGVKSARGFINNLVNPFAGIGDTPRQIPGSPNAVSVVDDVSRVVADTPQPWQMQELPGLHLKSTMSGSPLEKQLSKTGEISKKNIIAHINKAETSAADKFTLQKVLDQKFPNQNKIDYNDFRKAVSDEAIELERKVVADYEYNDWGLDRLGYPNAKRSNYDFAIKLLQDTIQELERKLSGAIEPTSWQTSDQIRKNLEMQLIGEKAQLANKLSEYEKLPLENVSVTYGNLTKFGRGNAKHFEEHTLGHARTLVSPEEPHIMHFLEQQSDWAQNLEKTKPINLEKYQEKLTRQEARYLEDLETLKKLKETKMDYLGNPKSDWEIAQFEDIINKKGAELNIRKGDIFNPQQKEFLGKAHQERLLQENVKYAAEQGKSSVRFPTPETAAKVQGYSKIEPVTDPIEISKIKEEIAEVEKLLKDNPGPTVEKALNEGLTRHKLNLSGGYSPKHQTILKKYSEQPKTIKKLFGKEPTIVTDSKGNTWYEFDIPEKFKQGKGEIKAYQRGGDTYNMQRALELGYTPDETSHWPSVDSTNGMWLKSTQHPTAWMESMYGYQLNPEVYKNYNIVYNPEGYFGDNQLQYVEKSQEYKIGGPLQTDPVLNFITQQQPRRFSKSKK